MAGMGFGKIFTAALALTALTACDGPGWIKLGGGNDAPVATTNSVQLVERDVEAPEVFQVTEAGLWDGRPSLGGVWVAHPSVTDPERVVIRNTTNGKFVIGALFRRERENPGPALQVSSDAAAALDILAGAPTELQVTALRREEAPVETPEATPVFDEPNQIEASTLDDETLIADVSAAIESAPLPDAAPAAAPAEALAKPYIQIGIFSIEANATRTADQLRATGIVPTVLEQTSQGRTFWRVIVGPAASTAERADLLAKVKAQGFTDAYAVTN